MTSIFSVVVVLSGVVARKMFILLAPLARCLVVVTPGPRTISMHTCTFQASVGFVKRQKLASMIAPGLVLMVFVPLTNVFFGQLPVVKSGMNFPS